MFQESRNNFYDSHDVYAQPRRAELPKVVPVQAAKNEMPASKIAGAVRRVALVELGHLSEDRVRLPFAVVPKLAVGSDGVNWQIHISSRASVEAKEALLHAEAMLQTRWRMLDMFQDARALIV